ncbi:MAG: STAS domain-containing protein [Mycobacterium sp.]|uniref:STAS domain-containing protein n=1 Tax=Mycobacterium sp. TaxID=1785 RepID=UPI003C510250
MSASDDLFTASVVLRDDIAILSIGGGIDFASAWTFEAVVANVLAGNVAGLIIDLAGVTFMASAGLRVLVLAQEKTACFAVAAPPRVLTRQIELLGLQKLLRLCPTVEDAVAALRCSLDSRGA